MNSALISVLTPLAGLVCPSLLCASSRNVLPLSPLLATPTDPTQPIENKTTLSLAFATLTAPLTRKSFVCHSYKKHRGGGYPQVGQTSVCLPFNSSKARNPFIIRTSKTQHLNSFRMNTYKKTGEGGGPHLSSFLCFFSPIFLNPPTSN